jgi:hypothetical protein
MVGRKTAEMTHDFIERMVLGILKRIHAPEASKSELFYQLARKELPIEGMTNSEYNYALVIIKRYLAL